MNAIQYHCPDANIRDVCLTKDGMGAVAEVPNDAVQKLIDTADDRSMSFEICKGFIVFCRFDVLFLKKFFFFFLFYSAA